MSGGNVAFHLRPNKFVERQLFIELLRLYCANDPISDYIYVSLGGPQLEDHKLMHYSLGMNSLISLESDEIVHGRQLFNRRPSYIDCRRQTAGEFIAAFDDLADSLFEDKKVIIWLDYASPRNRLEQLIDYQSLLSKLNAYDVAKITMNVNPATLAERLSNDTENDLLIRRATNLVNQLHDYLPVAKIDHKKMNSRGLPEFLCQVIRRASINGLSNSPSLRPVPLSLFCYQDGPHLMLTSTIAIIPVNNISDFKNDLSKRQWGYLPDSWTDVTRIDVPPLTAKERIHLEQMLFSDSLEEIHKKLPFKFHSREKASLKILADYAEHYRRYPSYFQVLL